MSGPQRATGPGGPVSADRSAASNRALRHSPARGGQADASSMEQGPILIRRVEPTDAPGLAIFYAGLSAESRATRFMGATRGITDTQAAFFACADGQSHDGF